MGYNSNTLHPEVYPEPEEDNAWVPLMREHLTEDIKEHAKKENRRRKLHDLTDDNSQR